MQIAGASTHGARAPASPISPSLSGEPGRAHQSPPPAAEARDHRQAGPTREASDNAAGPSADSRSSGAGGQQPRNLEQLQLAALASRDQEVRAHEQAHAAVGGSYAGAPSYTYSRGPDGKRYAVGGEVGIDVAVVPNDPQATLTKMETVVRAALAPAAPSVQDLRVAARAQAQMVQARTELLAEQAAAAQEPRSERADTAESTAAADQAQASQPTLELYRQVAGGQDAPGTQVDLIA